MLAYLDKQDSLRLKKNKVYEPFETELVKMHLKPGDIFIDVGAHIGYYTILAAEIVGKGGKVYSFEPYMENYKLLESNIEDRNLKNVFYYNRAVSDFNGKAKLYLNPNNSGDNRLFKSNLTEYEEIDVIRLNDDPLIKYELIDFIKIDVQGSELNVLKGATDLLNNNYWIKLLLECSPAQLRLNNTSSDKLIQFLHENGFEIYVFNYKTEYKPGMINPDGKAHYNLFCKRKEI